NAQIMALGESLKGTFDWSVETRRVSPELRRRTKGLLPRLACEAELAAAGLTPPWPDLIIGCGRAAAIIAQAIKPLSGGRMVHVQVGPLSPHPARFDLILTTAQYGIPPADNVAPLTLPIVRHDAERQ